MLKNEFQLAYEQVHRYMVVPQGRQKESYGTDIKGEPDCVIRILYLSQSGSLQGGFQISCIYLGRGLEMEGLATAPQAAIEDAPALRYSSRTSK